jgi:nicotinamide mononucleotide transporter
MIDWLNNNWIEVVGAIFMLGFLYLEIMQKWTMWILGILSGLFYVYIYFDQQLYALSGLMSYNVLVSIYGIYCWKFAKTKENKELPIIYTPQKMMAILSLIAVAVFIFIAFVLIQFTDIPNPLVYTEGLFSFSLDTFITTLSIIACWMAAKKMIESWYLWLIVDPLNVLLCVHKDMYPSVVLYAIYTIAAIIGYSQWKKVAIKQ